MSRKRTSRPLTNVIYKSKAISGRRVDVYPAHITALMCG